MENRFNTRTVTCSIRAEKEWFDLVKHLAIENGMNRNQFIIYVVNEHINNNKSFEDFNNGGIPDTGELFMMAQKESGIDNNE